MVTTTRLITVNRVDIATRWTAALDRAVAHGITVTQDPNTGTFTAPSTDGTRRYTVSWYGCGCAAGQGGDPVCLHRAAFRQHCRNEDRQVQRLLNEAIDREPVFPVLPQHLADLYEDPGEDGEPHSSDLLEPIEPDHRMCTSCLDIGWSRMYLGYGLNEYTETPCRCGAGSNTAA